MQLAGDPVPLLAHRLAADQLLLLAPAASAWTADAARDPAEDEGRHGQGDSTKTTSVDAVVAGGGEEEVAEMRSRMMREPDQPLQVRQVAGQRVVAAAVRTRIGVATSSMRPSAGSEDGHHSRRQRAGDQQGSASRETSTIAAADSRPTARAATGWARQRPARPRDSADQGRAAVHHDEVPRQPGELPPSRIEVTSAEAGCARRTRG